MTACVDKTTIRGRAGAASGHFLTLALALAAMIGAAPTQAEPRFVISGSPVLGDEFAPALIEGLARNAGLSLIRERAQNSTDETLRALVGVDPAFTVELRRSGASSGLRDLLAGEAEISMAARRVTAAENEAVAEHDLTSPESEHVVALDGLAIIVAPSNPIASISLREAALIFSGRLTDWRDLGMPAGPITVHSWDLASGEAEAFSTLALRPYGASILEDVAQHPSNDSISQAVAADPNAIGFAAVGATGDAKPAPVILECGVIVPPDVFSVKAEEYPLSRRLYFYTLGAPETPQARDLLNFALSDAAQPIITQAGLINQSMQTQDADGYSSRVVNAMQSPTAFDAKDQVRRFAEATRGAARLSMTFRFTEGDLLDARAFSDAGRLARWLERPENSAKSVSLIGFSDSRGPLEGNLEISSARAEAVRRAVLIQISPNFDPARLRVDAFGPVAPVACDDTEAGQLANRRVEVWVDN